jgi:dCMP deaminase
LARDTSTPSIEQSASYAPVPDVTSHPGTTFSHIDELLEYATKYWQEKFVTISIHDESIVEALFRRPFFVLVHIDAPIFLRWTRFRLRCAKAAVTPPPLEQFVLQNDEHFYTPSTGLATVASRAQIKLLNSTTSLPQLWASLDALNLTDPSRIRPAWDHYFMKLASLAARRSNCMRRQVGCVLVRNRRVMATGYNGTPRNIMNCNDGGCPRCNGLASGSGGADLSTCLCIHAEENALLEAGRERVGDAGVLYCNTCPCLTCTIKIVQVGITEVVYSESYYMDAEAAKIFQAAGVKLRQFSPPKEDLVDLNKLWEDLVANGRAPRWTASLGNIESWTHGVFYIEKQGPVGVNGNLPEQQD